MLDWVSDWENRSHKECLGGHQGNVSTDVVLGEVAWLMPVVFGVELVWECGGEHPASGDAP